MAVVKGPLFSLNASGTVAGAIVFTSWKGRNVVRRHAVPANPQSVGQMSVRAMLTFLTQKWAALSAAAKQTWVTRGAAMNVSPFNAYVSIGMSRWGTNHTPAQRDPATEADVAAVLSTPVGIAGSRSILVGCTVATLNQNWGLAFFRGILTGVGITRNELVYCHIGSLAQAYTWLDFPLTPGTEYFYRAYGFSCLGVQGTPIDEWSATPTE